MEWIRTLFWTSALGRILRVLLRPGIQAFVWTLLYYTSLYFSIHNRSLLIFSLLYWLGLWYITRNFSLAAFLVFFATLVFAKGKTFQIVLVPLDQIPHWAFFKISYFLPLYLSDVFLGCVVSLYVREKLQGMNISVPPVVRWPLVFLVAFSFWVFLTGSISAFPIVALVSFVQLARMVVVLFSPFMVRVEKNKLFLGILSVAVAVLLFESLWAIAQHILGGPLGRDIEVFLPRAEFGIRSSENAEVLRVTGTFFEPSILGTFLLMHISVIFLFLVEKRISQRFLQQSAVASIIIGSLALIFTGSRVLYLFWFIIGVVIWRRSIYQQKRYVRFFRVHRNVLIVGLALCVMTAFSFLAARLGSLADVFSHYGSASYRIQMYWYAIRLALSRPLIGVGINLSPYFLATGFLGERYVFDPTYPHNLFFQLLSETGFVGLGLFCLFLSSVMRSALSGKNRMVSPFFGAAMVYVGSAMVYPLFLNQQEIASYFFLFVGLYMLDISKGNQS